MKLGFFTAITCRRNDNTDLNSISLLLPHFMDHCDIFFNSQFNVAAHNFRNTILQIYTLLSAGTNLRYPCCRPSFEAAGVTDVGRGNHAPWSLAQERSACSRCRSGQLEATSSRISILKQGKPEKVRPG